MQKKPITKLSKQVASQTLTLVVSSLGLVAALAWNEAFKEYVDVYIKPYFDRGTGVLTLFFYALVITFITVLVTIQLNKITEKVTKE